MQIEVVIRLIPMCAAVHDYYLDPKAKGGRRHATIPSSTQAGLNLN